MPQDKAIARLAARQHGLVTTGQLRELGLSRKVVSRRVTKGQWLKVAPTVLRLAGTPVTWESHVLEHVLAAGPGAVASHRSAAVLWKLDGAKQGKPEVAVPNTRCPAVPGARLHRSGDLDRVPVVRRSNIPTTPIERTLLDLGAVVSFERVQLAIDDALRRKLTNIDRLLDTLVRHARRGRDGVGPLRAALERLLIETDTTDSGFERLVLTLLAEVELPPPVLHHQVCIDGRTYKPDLAYPDHMVAIELDGGVHLRRDVWEADHARQNALVLAGWTLLRFTWTDYSRSRHRLVREIHTALTSPKT